jgi:hypothetical protein
MYNANRMRNHICEDTTTQLHAICAFFKSYKIPLHEISLKIGFSQALLGQWARGATIPRKKSFEMLKNFYEEHKHQPEALITPKPTKQRAKRTYIRKSVYEY